MFSSFELFPPDLLPGIYLKYKVLDFFFFFFFFFCKSDKVLHTILLIKPVGYIHVKLFQNPHKHINAMSQVKTYEQTQAYINSWMCSGITLSLLPPRKHNVNQLPYQHFRQLLSRCNCFYSALFSPLMARLLEFFISRC